VNRIDRLSAILIQLQSQRVVKAQEIADRFGISLRTVYRDIRSLEGSGIPILGEAGVGYSIMEGFRLPPVMLTREEATSFLTAEKFISTMTDKATRESYRSALFKIKAILRSEEQDFLEDIEPNIEVIPNANAVEVNSQKDLGTILNAISSKEVLSLVYNAASSGVQTTRSIEPIGVFYSHNSWHLIAWCKLRNAYRDFRLDRMATLKSCGSFFTKVHPTLKDYLQEIAEERQLNTAVVSFTKESARYAQRQKFFNGFVRQIDVGNRVEMTFLTISLDGLARWLLMYTNEVEIKSPPQLQQHLKFLVDDLKSHYK